MLGDEFEDRFIILDDEELELALARLDLLFTSILHVGNGGGRFLSHCGTVKGSAISGRAPWDIKDYSEPAD